jgi:hypothetical protein
MTLFLLKLAVTPTLLVLISILQQRLGHRVGGIFTGLPVSFGIISCFVAIEQGQVYVQHSTGAMMMGMVAFVFFCITYLECAKKHGGLFSICVSLAVYLAVAIPLSLMPLPLPMQFTLALLFPLAGFYYLKKQVHHKIAAAIKPPSLGLRAGASVAFLLLVTFLAYMLPPIWLGILAILPIVTSIMLVFSHRDYGNKILSRLVLGVFTGSYGSLAFLAVLAWAPLDWGIAATFTLATTAALLAASITNIFSRKERLEPMAD